MLQQVQHNKALSILSLSNAYAGLLKIEEIIDQNPYPVFDLRKYYNHYINYQFDDEKRKALKLFLDLSRVL